MSEVSQGTYKLKPQYLKNLEVEQWPFYTDAQKQMLKRFDVNFICIQYLLLYFCKVDLKILASAKLCLMELHLKLVRCFVIFVSVLVASAG